MSSLYRFCTDYCPWVGWLKNLLSSSHAAYTYFYKGANYWRFDNHKIEADKGYPRSILKDFMGCVGAPDPKPDKDTEQEPTDKPVNPSDRGKDEHKEPDRGKDTNPEEDQTSKPDSKEEDEDKEVNVVVMVADNESKVMTLIMVIVPLVLILCILVLIYAILRTLQNKETPRALVHCKRSLQDWVWGTELEEIERVFIICWHHNFYLGHSGKNFGHSTSLRKQRMGPIHCENFYHSSEIMQKW